MAPWAEVLYGCDHGWWRERNGVPEFQGVKLSQDATTCARYRDVHKIDVQRDEHKLLLDQPGVIGSGYNSGFQALNLVVQFGVKRVILVGLDMRLGERGEVHWHGRHAKGLSNPTVVTIARWRDVMDRQVKTLKHLGVAVINASEISALTAFPKMSFLEALECCP